MKARVHSAGCDDGVDMIRMSGAEYQTAVQNSLAELGVTYAELAAQADTRRFSSPDAADLWALIRGTVTPPARA